MDNFNNTHNTVLSALRSRVYGLGQTRNNVTSFRIDYGRSIRSKLCNKLQNSNPGTALPDDSRASHEGSVIRTRMILILQQYDFVRVMS